LRTECPQFPAAFTKDAADKTGLSDRTIRRAIELTRILTPEIRALLQFSPIADNAAQLRALARETPKAQLQIAELIAKGAARNIMQARQLAGLVTPSETDAHQLQASKLIALYGRASAKARRTFLAHFNLVANDAEAA
jgi:ParB family chromosome partitioning protein